MSSNRGPSLFTIRKNSRGIAIFMVLAIVGVLSILGIFISKFTSAQKGQILGGYNSNQADNLLAAAINIALTKATVTGNSLADYEAAASKEQHPYSLFKRPLEKTSTKSSTNDCELALSGLPEVAYGPADINLTELAEAMNLDIQNLEVKISLEKAYSVEPSSGSSNVPGVDLKPWMRVPTENYVKNGSIEPINIHLPSVKLTELLNFKANISIAGIPTPIAVPLPIGTAIEKIAPSLGLTIPAIEFNSIFNALFGGISGVSFPISVTISISSPSPKVAAEWGNLYPGISQPPAGAGDGPSPTWTSEKYGLARVKATIEYKPKRDSSFTTRAAETQVEFRTSDCQPPASLYTLFIQNRDDSLTEDVFLKNKNSMNISDGCRVYLNNMSVDFFKQLIASAPALTIPDPDIVNFPGLVRMNGTKTYLCSVPWFKPTINPVEAGREFFGLLMDWKKIIPAFKTTTLLGILISSAVATVVGLISNANDMIGWLKTEGWKKIVKAGASTWEWPYSRWPDFPPGEIMGDFDLGVFFLPNPLDAGNTFFPFGDYGVSPPLWREIEGKVNKVYFEWCLYLITGVCEIPPIMWGVPVPIMLMEAKNDSPYGYAKQTAVSTTSFLNEALATLNDAASVSYPGDTSIFKSNNSFLGPAPGCETQVTLSPAQPENLAPDLCQEVQYQKKAALYYTSADEFKADWDNYYDGQYLNLPGVIFFEYDPVQFPPDNYTDSDIKVRGRGILVAKGNMEIRANVFQGEYDANSDVTKRVPTVSADNEELRKETTLTLMALNGMLNFTKTGDGQLVEAACFSALPIATKASKVHINGNLSCDLFSKMGIEGELVINYRSTRTRVSAFSTNPSHGKYDPKRFALSFGQRSNTRYGRE